MLNNSFYPKVTLLTRLSINPGTLIGNLLCKLSEATLNTTSGILIKKFSDYILQCLKISNIKIINQNMLKCVNRIQIL